MKIITTSQPKPPRILLYSVEGLGKSTFGASAVSPIFIQTEDGLDEINVARFPKAETFEDVLTAMRFLYTEPHNFKTLVIDTIDWLEALVWKTVCDRHKKNHIEDFGYGKGYKFAMDEWNVLLRGLSALREEKNMAIILLAHADIKRFDSPETEPYDRYCIKTHASITEKLSEWCDAVLFANYVITIEKTDVGFNKKVVRGSGGGYRMMYTEERPAFRAKNRYGLPAELPFEKNSAWDTLMSAIVAARAINGAAAPTAKEKK